MKESDLDMDSTQALLDSTIPDTPDFVDSVIQDSDEDEIFFGETSYKEKKGTYAKCTRRDTICLTDVDNKRRRSFNVADRSKSRDFLFSQQTSKERKSSSRSSLYSQENSIMEEDEDDCVFAVPTVQVEEVSSTVFDECEELEIGVKADQEGDIKNVVQEEQNFSLNVTGRKYRNKKYRNNLESIVSLPSATKLKEAECDYSMEGERMAHMDHGLELREDVDIAQRRCEYTKETNSRLHSDRSISSCTSGESVSTEESDSASPLSDLGPESDYGGVGSDCPVLEQSRVSDDYSADMSSVSDGIGISGDVFDQHYDISEVFDEMTEDPNDNGEVVCEDVSVLSSVGHGDYFEVSGVESLSQTDGCKEDSTEGMSETANEDGSTTESVNDDTATTDTSYANSTANSGVVTFKEDTSVSGVYDSFSDDTQDEFLHDTDVQENSDVGQGGRIPEYSGFESNDSFDDVGVNKFSSVKRNIFDGESDMESFVLGSVASELDVAEAPFTLGSVASNLNSVDGSSFVLGSVVSELGSVMLAGNHVQHSGGELSLNLGDDSVFTRNSLQGHFTLSHSFEVPDEGSGEDTDTDTVGNISGNGMELDLIDDAATDNTFHDQSEEVVDDGHMEGNDMPQILLTRPSLPNNIPSDDERSSSPEFMPASPDISARSIYHTAPTSHNATDMSPMFDTTAEEMMLFEMYGESYDEKVEVMTKEQKLALKEKLTSRDQEEINMVAEKLHKIMEEKARESSIGSTISPFSLASSTPSFHIPSDLRLESTDTYPPTPTHVETSPPVQIIPNQLKGSTENLPEDHEFRIPTPFSRYPTEVTYHLPTSASLGKMVTITPSPKKTISNPWLPPSPSPKYTSVHSPSKSATISRPPISKIPQPVHNSHTPQRVLQTLSTPQRVCSTTPNSAKKYSRVAGLKAAEYAAVASPVAEYVKSNPAPPLVQNVKAKTCQRDLESTLVEVEDKENREQRLSLVPACPLPAAVYKTGTLSEEQMVDVTGPEYAYIPEAYGTVNTSAKVTKHVARVRVGAGQAGLKWNESCLVNDESLNSSPSVAKYKAPAKSVLKQTRRDSGLFDESMLEMSVHETKVVRKMASGRGRGKAKK